MKKIFFIHFHEAELKEKIQPLKQAGYKVDYHFSTETTANFKDDLTGCFSYFSRSFAITWKSLCRMVVGSKEKTTYTNYFLWW